jgi:hypothetical protein
MYGYVDSGGGAKALCVFVGVLLIIAIVGGVYLGGSELFSPSVHRAKAEKLDAEAAALRAQTAYEQQKHEIELALAEKKAAAELQTLQERRARQLELMEPVTIVGVVVGSIVALTLTVTISYHFITRGRPVREMQMSTSRQPVYHDTQGSSKPEQKQEAASETGQTPSLADRAKRCLNDITYEGFLAYVHDYIFQPDSARVFYHAGIAPQVEDTYLTVLVETKIITWKTNGCSGWHLPGEIRDVADVRQRISRRAFYRLVSSCQTLNAVESLILHSAVVQREPSPAFSNG